jgi:hypothetical protein
MKQPKECPDYGTEECQGWLQSRFRDPTSKDDRAIDVMCSRNKDCPLMRPGRLMAMILERLRDRCGG